MIESRCIPRFEGCIFHLMVIHGSNFYYITIDDMLLPSILRLASLSPSLMPLTSRRQSLPRSAWRRRNVRRRRKRHPRTEPRRKRGVNCLVIPVSYQSALLVSCLPPISAQRGSKLSPLPLRVTTPAERKELTEKRCVGDVTDSCPTFLTISRS